MPVPFFDTVKVYVTGIRLNVAVTFLVADMLTTHVPVPVQPSPDQPAKLEPLTGVAVSVTCVPDK